MPDDHVKKTIAAYDEIAEEYIAKIQKYAPKMERERFASMVKPGGKILDAGCGSGRDSWYLSERGFTVVGIDLSDRLLDYADRYTTASCSFQKMDLRKISFTDGSFDGIWACASLLHLTREEIVPVIKRLYEVLVSGGVLFLLMKEGKGEKYLTNEKFRGDTRFFTWYTQDEIRSLLGTVEFSVLDMFTWDQKNRNAERPHEIWISTFAKK